MSCFSCCKSDADTSFRINPTELSNESRNTFKSFLAAISHKTDSSRKGGILSEIRRHGTAKNNAKVFTYQELADATDNFSTECLIGEGGYGKVYKGYIQSLEQTVAVKQLNREGSQGSKEFLSEVLMLSWVKHPNLVMLIGYCVDGDQRILVYELMSNGTLENHLLDLAPDQEPLEWRTRMKIVEGAAKGLQYLHDTAKPQVIYRDFKASNILLDEDFNPKLSDFGLAKLVSKGGRHRTNSKVMGTFGYCSPEYATQGVLTTKADVYTFGVVFLEMITGRRVIDTARATEEQNLIDWAQPLLEDKEKFTLTADPLLKDNVPEKGLFKALAVAAVCLQAEADTRPFMSEVVTAIQHLAVSRYEDKCSEPLKCAGHVESIQVGSSHGDQQLASPPH